jgi:cutinase
LFCAVVVTASAPITAQLGIRSASAAPCPDVEVVFARGTTELPGVGAFGQDFVDSLRTRVGGRSLEVYPVDYPATTDFPTAVDGITDASNHILATAAACPKTKMVLGGYSQGAAVMGFVTASLVPDGVLASDVPKPMPPDVADHVAAVALLGKPSDRFMRVIGQPSVTIGPLYTAKTIDLCVDNDPVCSSEGRDLNAHYLYESDGIVDQAAAFAASRVLAPELPPPSTHLPPGNHVPGPDAGASLR